MNAMRYEVSERLHRNPMFDNLGVFMPLGQPIRLLQPMDA